MAHDDKASQEFLDQNQYTKKGILRYEKIFGKGFISTGGLETTQEFVPLLDLKPGQKVLDVGCGLGGSGFYMTKNFQVDVMGVDLSTNMISIAKERAAEDGESKMQFLITDITEQDYEQESFDVIYSRDTLLHIKGKEALFLKFFKWLKPGGQVLVTDYCCNAETMSERMKAYVAQRGYHLPSVSEYGKMFERAGFTYVKAEDKTTKFMEILTKEKERLEKSKDEFLKDFPQKDYDDLISGWESKLVRCAAGDQHWGLFHAKK